ncbi:MAG: hypothetical protein Q7U36_03180 [bacterium]|nr:hypothetical protein [bacterium]
MKKITLVPLLFLGVIIFSGCGEKTEQVNNGEKATEVVADNNSPVTAKTAEGICGIFSKEFVASATGLNVTTAETYATEGVESSNCRYYIDGKKIAPVITIGKFKNDLEKEKKKYTEHPLFKGWRILKNDTIPMDNLVTYNEVGQLNDIFLITGTNEYYRLTLYSFKTIGSNEMITLALKAQKEIGK